MLLFPNFMLPCRSVLPNIRTCSAFWLQDWSFISLSIVHVTRSMGWRLGMGGVKYSVTVLEAFPLSHSIKMLFVFHIHDSVEVLLLHAFISQTSLRFSVIQMMMPLKPCWGLFTQWELWPEMMSITIFWWYLKRLEITAKIFYLRTAIYKTWQFPCF